jgi:predicted nucleotidyltransferase
MRVQTKEAVLSAIEAHSKEIKAAGVRSLGLFGSFVRSEQTPESDLDVLLEFDPSQKTFDNFMNQRRGADSRTS